MSAPNAVADALAGRLSAALARLIGRPVGQADRFALAVSGGADSMAMLGLMTQGWPGQVAAATVDHGLREAARDEAQMVERWCAEHRVPHCILTADLSAGGNVQATARAARYILLEEWQAEQGFDWLLTAHQADDQIETLLLRLTRGAGVGGLISIRARRDRLLRPLLGERRAVLRAWCVAQAMPFVDDPSNGDARFDRARLRERLAGIGDEPLIDPVGLARSLAALGEAEVALDWMADQIEAENVTRSDDALVLQRTDLPREVLRRLLLRMIARTNPDADPPRGPSVDQAIVQLFDRKTVALADCLVSGGAYWRVCRAPARRVG